MSKQEQEGECTVCWIARRMGGLGPLACVCDGKNKADPEADRPSPAGDAAEAAPARDGEERT